MRAKSDKVSQWRKLWISSTSTTFAPQTETIYNEIVDSLETRNVCKIVIEQSMKVVEKIVLVQNFRQCLFQCIYISLKAKLQQRCKCRLISCRKWKCLVGTIILSTICLWKITILFISRTRGGLKPTFKELTSWSEALKLSTNKTKIISNSTSFVLLKYFLHFDL